MFMIYNVVFQDIKAANDQSYVSDIMKQWAPDDLEDPLVPVLRMGQVGVLLKICFFLFDILLLRQHVCKNYAKVST